MSTDELLFGVRSTSQLKGVIGLLEMTAAKYADALAEAQNAELAQVTLLQKKHVLRCLLLLFLLLLLFAACVLYVMFLGFCP